MDRYTIEDIKKFLFENSHEVVCEMSNGPDIIQYQVTCDSACIHVMLSDVEMEIKDLQSKVDKITRCRDCRFAEPYPPDEFFRDCRMMLHKIVPVDCFCALGKPKEAS